MGLPGTWRAPFSVLLMLLFGRRRSISHTTFSDLFNGISNFEPFVSELGLMDDVERKRFYDLAIKASLPKHGSTSFPKGWHGFWTVPGLAILAGFTGGLWRPLRLAPAPRGDDKFQIELKPVCVLGSFYLQHCTAWKIPNWMRILAIGWHRLWSWSTSVGSFLTETHECFGYGSAAGLLTSFTTDGELICHVTVLIAWVMGDVSYGVAPSSSICFDVLLG